MDAGTRASILDEALARLEAGDGTTEGRLKVLSTVFTAGYGYGLSQGHYDRDVETPGTAAHAAAYGDVVPHRHNRRGVDYTCMVCPDRQPANTTLVKDGEPAATRYAREAKARLAARIGDSLAEEFTSVAASTERDTINTAELMAVAYEMGKQAARQAREPADHSLASAEPERPCQSTYATDGQHDWDSYLGKCANPGCHEPGYPAEAGS
jgi:hypothetical protein